MTVRSGPIYESRVFVEPEAAGDYDAWFEERANRARHDSGIVDVVSFRIEPDDQGRAGRVCQFTLEDDEALERFVDEGATDIEA